MKLLAAIMMGFIALVGWSTAPRAAELFTYSADVLPTGPFFILPGPGPTFTPTGKLVPYHVQFFEVNRATTCTVTSIQIPSKTTPFAPWDGDVVVYQSAFTPGNPALNAVVYDDDDGAAGGLGQTTSRTEITPATAGGFPVLPNTPYIVVTAGHNATASPTNGNSGNFVNTISCGASGSNFPTPLLITHGSGSNLGSTKTLLAGNRFQVSATFTTAPGGPVSNAQLTPAGSDNTALFAFFESGNWELLIKVLNFCGSPDQLAWRVFAAGTTTVGVTVTVVDTLRSGTAVITNALHSPFQNQVVPIPGSCP